MAYTLLTPHGLERRFASLEELHRWTSSVITTPLATPESMRDAMGRIDSVLNGMADPVRSDAATAAALRLPVSSTDGDFKAVARIVMEKRANLVLTKKKAEQ
jgi:hypothetical protein